MWRFSRSPAQLVLEASTTFVTAGLGGIHVREHCEHNGKQAPGDKGGAHVALVAAVRCRSFVFAPTAVSGFVLQTKLKPCMTIAAAVCCRRTLHIRCTSFARRMSVSLQVVIHRSASNSDPMRSCMHASDR